MRKRLLARPRARRPRPPRRRRRGSRRRRCESRPSGQARHRADGRLRGGADGAAARRPGTATRATGRRPALLAHVRRRSAAEPRSSRTINLGIPVRKSALGARAEGLHRVPAELLRRRAVREHLRGATRGRSTRTTGQVLWRRRGGGPKPSTPAIAGPRLIVSSKDGTVTALDAVQRARRVAAPHRTRRSSPRRSSSTGSPTSAPRTGGCSRSTSTTGTIHWAYDTGRPDQREPVGLRRPDLHHDLRRLDLLPAPQRRAQALEHVRQARPDPLRELLREPLDRRRAPLHDLPLGHGRDALGA